MSVTATPSVYKKNYQPYMCYGCDQRFIPGQQLQGHDRHLFHLRCFRGMTTGNESYSHADVERLASQIRDQILYNKPTPLQMDTCRVCAQVFTNVPVIRNPSLVREAEEYGRYYARNIKMFGRYVTYGFGVMMGIAAYKATELCLEHFFASSTEPHW